MSITVPTRPVVFSSLNRTRAPLLKRGIVFLQRDLQPFFKISSYSEFRSGQNLKRHQTSSGLNLPRRFNFVVDLWLWRRFRPLSEPRGRARGPETSWPGFWGNGRPPGELPIPLLGSDANLFKSAIPESRNIRCGHISK